MCFNFAFQCFLINQQTKTFMTRIFLYLLIFMAFAGVCHGQGPHNLIVFSQNGETFTLFINGNKQNETPAANVKAADLRGSACQLRVLFDKALPGEFSRNMPLPEGSSELTYQLKKNSKGAWTVGLVSEVPYVSGQQSAPVSKSNPALEPAKAPVSSEKSVPTISPTRPPAAPVGTSNSQPSTKPSNTQSQEVFTTTTTTTTGSSATSGTVGISMSADENNVGVNISVDDRTAPTTNTKVVTTQTTTTSGTSATGGTVGINMSADQDNLGINISIDDRTAPTTTTTVITTQTTTQVNVEKDEYVPVEKIQVEQTQTYNTQPDTKPQGCQDPMRSADFSKAMGSISSKSFEDSKLSIAKQITRANCLASSQVKEIMELFSFEDTRLQFAKFAYDYTYDKGNYFIVNDAFNFESTIEELDSYLQNK